MGCGSTLTTLSKHRDLAIMKIPCMREAIGREFPQLLEGGPHWEQYVESKFKWEPKAVNERSKQVHGMPS